MLRSVLPGADDEPRPSGDVETPIAVGREPEAASERAVKGGHAMESMPNDGEPAAGTASGAGEKPADSIKGIGAAYAERLEEAGVHTVSDLAAADAEDLAAETDVGAGRLENWIERARAQTK